MDTGATNPNNAGKVYIGKTVDFARREAQHGGRVTPGSFEVIDRMPGATNTQMRAREQYEINKQLMLQGASPFDVKSGTLANLCPKRAGRIKAGRRLSLDRECRA